MTSLPAYFTWSKIQLIRLNRFSFLNAEHMFKVVCEWSVGSVQVYEHSWYKHNGQSARRQDSISVDIARQSLVIFVISLCLWVVTTWYHYEFYCCVVCHQNVEKCTVVYLITSQLFVVKSTSFSESSRLVQMLTITAET